MNNKEIINVPKNKYISTEKINIYITPEFDQQITYYHSKVDNIEWCCILFYKIEGDMNNIKDLKITPIYGHMIDIGTASYTSSDINENFIEGVEIFEKEFGVEYDNKTYRIGMLHTHHHMKTFFSSVDLDEIYENSDKHLYYLSLIVNHNGNYSAKVCVRSNIEENSVITTKNNHKINLSSNSECLLIFDCDINRFIPKEIENTVKNLLDNKKSIANSNLKTVEGYKNHSSVKNSTTNFDIYNLPSHLKKVWNNNKCKYDIIDIYATKDYYSTTYDQSIYCENFNTKDNNNRNKEIQKEIPFLQKEIIKNSKEPFNEIFDSKKNKNHNLLKNVINDSSLIKKGVRNIKTISDLCKWMDINCKDQKDTDTYSIFANSFLEELIKNCDKCIEDETLNLKSITMTDKLEACTKLSISIVSIISKYRNYYYSVDDIMDVFNEYLKEIVDEGNNSDYNFSESFINSLITNIESEDIFSEINNTESEDIFSEVSDLKLLDNDFTDLYL